MAPVSSRIKGMAHGPTSRQLIHKNVLVELSVSHNKACMLCKHKIIDEKLYGKLYQLNDVIVHHFCILLSSKSVQNGADHEGIYGFLLKDIHTEIKRGSTKTCTYCAKKGATISCCKKKCKIIFHLPCGLKNGSMNQYFDAFNSFCQQHRIVPTIDTTVFQNTAAVQCGICMDDIQPSILPSSIWGPCCKNNTWFHQSCVQELAFNAGYRFKCPLCNDNKIFNSRMLTLGIFIPSRNATWETESNEYAEFSEPNSKCNVTVCLCPRLEKRAFTQSCGPWEIILCHLCHLRGTHRICSIIECDQTWCCTICQSGTDS